MEVIVLLLVNLVPKKFIYIVVIRNNNVHMDCNHSNLGPGNILVSCSELDIDY